MQKSANISYTGIFKILKSENPEQNTYVKLVISAVTIIIISLFLPSFKDADLDVDVGTIWSSEDLIAPFTFPVYKSDTELDAEIKEIKNNIIPVFTITENSSGSLKDTVKMFIGDLNAEFKRFANDKKNSIKTDFRKVYFYEKYGTDLNMDIWDYLFSYYSGEIKDSSGLDYNEYINLIQKNINQVAKIHLIDVDKTELKSGKIAYKKKDDKIQRIENVENVVSVKELKDKIAADVGENFSDSRLSEAATVIYSAFVKPNLIQDNELTVLEVQSRIEKLPKTIGIVKENERIISKHDPITVLTKQKLESYKKVRLEQFGVQDFVAQFLGRVLTIFIILVVSGLYLYYLRNDIFHDNLKLVLISSLIILVSFFAFISMQLNVNAPVALLIFLSVASILLTIIFDARIAFFIIVIITFLIAAIRGGDYAVSLISFCGSVLAIFSVRDIKNRTQIFRSFYFILAGYTISILAIGLDRSENISKILINIAYGGINSVMSPVIAYGLLIFYERAFKITTDLTLVELADFNQPLLRELSSKAPGTFHHSVVMGNLAEEAAAAIGANRVLSRVGCYYHDIGKIAKPDFFVENQMERKNKHESLNPNLSTKIILAHVKEGIELARKNKLPQEVIDFIPMHHGTTLVSFFYRKAQETADEKKEDVFDYIYRYPGPKPQTRETAIAMLADTVEASTKAIDDPTAKKLEDKIDEIIKKRFIEGELDECELTLRDLTKIKRSFLKILVGIYHQRIKYPEEIRKDE
jgi:cyclic-di-AMP phosphodiesterase PgpH